MREDPDAAGGLEPLDSNESPVRGGGLPTPSTELFPLPSEGRDLGKPKWDKVDWAY